MDSDPSEPVVAQEPIVSQEEKSPQDNLIVAPAPKKRGKRLLLGLFLVFIVACLSYGYVRYEQLRKNIIVSGGGNTSILHYTTDKASVPTLEKPGDGRYNILILGIGGTNDQGVSHTGTLLTDSIQVLSIDTINKKASMTSVPRDFYYATNHGAGKINAVYEYGEMDHPGGGGQAVRTAVGKILGVNISNFVVVDFTAAKEAIDEVGGVDITVPKALYDPAYPCDDDVHYCPFSISAGLHHMDGTLALKYMRTRHADNDFERSSRQQVVLSALKDKALSLGVLTNPVKVNNLLDILSKHIHTDLQPSEIQSLISTYKDISTANTTSNVLETGSQLGLLDARTDPIAGYVEYPVGGNTDYSSIQQWFQKNNPDPFITQEHATVAVANGSPNYPEAFTAFTQKLEDYGFNVQIVTPTAALPSSLKTQLFSTQAARFPITKQYLGILVTPNIQDAAPLGTSANFEIIYKH